MKIFSFFIYTASHQTEPNRTKRTDLKVNRTIFSELRPNRTIFRFGLMRCVSIGFGRIQFHGPIGRSAISNLLLLEN